MLTSMPEAAQDSRRAAMPDIGEPQQCNAKKPRNDALHFEID